VATVRLPAALGSIAPPLSLRDRSLHALALALFSSPSPLRLELHVHVTHSCLPRAPRVGHSTAVTMKSRHHWDALAADDGNDNDRCVDNDEGGGRLLPMADEIVVLRPLPTPAQDSWDACFPPSPPCAGRSAVEADPNILAPSPSPLPRLPRPRMPCSPPRSPTLAPPSTRRASCRRPRVPPGRAVPLPA